MSYADYHAAERRTNAAAQTCCVLLQGLVEQNSEEELRELVGYHASAMLKSAVERYKAYKQAEDEEWEKAAQEVKKQAPPGYARTG